MPQQPVLPRGQLENLSRGGRAIRGKPSLKFNPLIGILHGTKHDLPLRFPAKDGHLQPLRVELLLLLQRNNKCSSRIDRDNQSNRDNDDRCTLQRGR